MEKQSRPLGVSIIANFYIVAGMVLAIFENGILFVTNQKLTLEMPREI
jgi:hypothetical protein